MRRILEVLVSRFQETVIEPVHLNLGQQVRTKENAVGVVEEKGMRRIRLPSQFRDARTNVDQQVRQRIQLLCEKSQVLAAFGTMRTDERRRGMPGNHAIALLQQCPR